MVAEKIDNPHRFGLFNDVRAYALAHQLKRPGQPDSTLLSVTPGSAIIDESRQTMQFGVSKRGRFSNVAVAAPRRVWYSEKSCKNAIDESSTTRIHA